MIIGTGGCNWAGFGRRMQHVFVRRNCALQWATLLALSGCVTPPTDGKKVKASKEVSPPVAAEPKKEEEPAPQKPETLAAVEDFLSRTQEYRLPVKAEATKIVQPATPLQSATTIQPPPSPAQAVPAPKDAAYANAQISIGDVTPPPTPPAIPAVESVSVRSSATKSTSLPSSAKPGMANSASELQAIERNDVTESLVASLKEELKAKKDVATEWKLRGLLLSLDRTAEESAVGDNSPAELKGVLPAWGAASSAIRELLRNPGQDTDAALERVDALRGTLAVRSNPHVKNVAMCRKVLTYGSYEEMAPEDLVSGRSIQTIVYAEIENLRAAAESKGSYETRLSTRLEVMTSDGKSMWQREEPDVVDRCRSPRRDFFVAQRITLPPTLPVGNYVLKFSVEDKAAGTMAESSASFEIRSPVSVAKGP